MGKKRAAFWSWTAVWALLSMAGLQPAVAQNAAFQSYFFDVCASGPSGALADRCAETPGGSGDISGDSEDSLNPSQVLAINQSALAQARALGKEVQERLERGRETDGGDAPKSRVFSRWAIPAQGRSETLERDATTLERGFELDLSGLQLGTDLRLSERAFVGVLFSFERTDSSFDPDQPGVNFTPPASDGGADTDSYSVTLYGSHSIATNGWVDGSIGYGATDYEFRRNAVFQESTRSSPQTNVGAVGDTDGDELTLGVGVGFDGSRGGLTGGVFIRGDYVDTQVDGYVERDSSGLQLAISDASQSSLTSTLGLRGSYAASRKWGVLVPHARIEYEHEFDQDAQSVDTRLILDPTANVFRLQGDEPDEGVVNASLGLMAVLRSGWMTFADIEVLVGHTYLDRRRVTLGIRKEL